MKTSTPQIPLPEKLDRMPELKPIIGLPFRHIDRNATTLQAHFGELREINAEGKRINPTGDWVLEVFGPCPWRMSRGGRIFVGSGDFDESFGGDDCDPFTDKVNTRFDLSSYFFHNEFANNPTVAESVEMDGLEGFTLHLSRGLQLVVFPADSDVSLNPRYWRLSSTKHI